MAKHPVEKGIEDVIKTYELLDRVRLRRDLVIRDDQFDYEAIVEAARHSRQKKYRVCLVDTGLFDAAGIEWLIKEGVRFYTSDEARPRAEEIFPLVKAARKHRIPLPFFLNGPIDGAGKEETLSPEALKRLLEDGMDLHLTNRNHDRDFSLLDELSETAGKNRGYLVYYHHGLPGPEMQELAACGTWVHFSDRDIPLEGDFSPILDIAGAAAAGGTKAAVHVEKGLALERLESLWDAGAVLLFKIPPSDYASEQRLVEKKALRRRLPPRAFYLTTDFLP